MVEGNIDEAKKFEQLRNLFSICFEELNQVSLNIIYIFIKNLLSIMSIKQFQN